MIQQHNTQYTWIHNTHSNHKACGQPPTPMVYMQYFHFCIFALVVNSTKQFSSFMASKYLVTKNLRKFTNQCILQHPHTIVYKAYSPAFAQHAPFFWVRPTWHFAMQCWRWPSPRLVSLWLCESKHKRNTTQLKKASSTVDKPFRIHLSASCNQSVTIKVRKDEASPLVINWLGFYDRGWKKLMWINWNSLMSNVKCVATSHVSLAHSCTHAFAVWMSL